MAMAMIYGVGNHVCYDRDGNVMAMLIYLYHCFVSKYLLDQTDYYRAEEGESIDKKITNIKCW